MTAVGAVRPSTTVGVHDIRFNQDLTNAYYGRILSPKDIAAGGVANPLAQPLRQALAKASTVAK